MPQYAKKIPPYGDPIAHRKKDPVFMPWPSRPAGELIAPLATVAPDAAKAVAKHGKLVFHTVGDTGGVDGSETQERIAAAMQEQIDKLPVPDQPHFFTF